MSDNGKEKVGRWLSSLAFFFALAGPAAAHTLLLSPLAGFSLFFLSGVLGLAGGAASLVVDFRKGPAARSGLGLMGLILPILLLILYASGRKYPPINDVSTDLVDVPSFSAAPALAENSERNFAYPEEFKAIVRDAYPDLRPLHLPVSSDRVFDQVASLLKSRTNIEVIRIDERAREIEFIAESALFRFRDDVVIRVRSVNEGTVVDMRSKSRDGRGDLGANANRIRLLLTEIDQNSRE